MGRRILTDEQSEEACALRERGLSCQQIANKFAARGVSVSAGSIEWTCLTRGADIPDKQRRPNCSFKPGLVVARGGHVVRAFTSEEDQQLLELDLEGLSLSEIGRRLGRRHNSIKGRMAILARRDSRGAR